MNNFDDIQADAISERLYKIYTESNRELLETVQNIITPKSTKLANCFYDNLLLIKETHLYLDHHLVSERLHRSMAEWIESLFLPHNKSLVTEHIKWQQKIGDVHARIGIPLRLVNYGVRLLKTEMVNLIKESRISYIDKFQGVVLVNDLMDFSSSLINESYITYRMMNEQNSQSLRMHIMSYSLIVELERIRASLFDWLRRTITEIYASPPNQKPMLDSVYSSDFGLWVIYKAELLLADRPDLVESLKKQLGKIEENISRLNQLDGGSTQLELAKAIEYLNDSISNATWLLGQFSMHTYEMETGRDPLTRLFNRRFLPAVMKNMVSAAKSTSSVFSVISCDLDSFKEVNDRYGHEIGDKVLVYFGDFLASEIRATDYVFRMGGDEFLIILAGADSKIAMSVAKKILENLDKHKFEFNGGTTINLSTSMGIAIFDGHPDYVRILDNADDALYEAKKRGKNTFYIISS